MTIKVAVVDDQALVRRGLALVLNHQPDIEVVAEAGNGVEALDATRRHRPDVVLMDIRMASRRWSISTPLHHERRCKPAGPPRTA